MNKFLLVAALSAGVLAALPASAGLFSSCDAGSVEPRPDWVSKPDYSLPGYYVGVGSAEADGKAAEGDARGHLVQNIEVKIIAETSKTTTDTDGKVQREAQARVIATSDEVLRGLQIKARWIDPQTCTHYTLMAISEKSVAQAKREKLMKQRIENFKVLLADGTDRDRNRDIKVRRKYLEDAQALLADSDFGLLPDELGKEVYAKRLQDAQAMLDREMSHVQGRTALFAINQDVTLSADVIGRMLDQLRAGDNTTDRLMADCNTVNDCIAIAKERGFTMLALLKTGSQIVPSQMGSLKGTLTISRTVYDIESRKVLKADTVSAQVIGWSNEELDWSAAAEKAMQGLK